MIPDSYADRAGLQFGDKIVAVGDVETLDWESALVAILDNMVATGKVPLTLENEQGGHRRATIDVGSDSTRLTEPGALFDGLGFADLAAPFPLAVASWRPEALPNVAGIRAGDAYLLSVDGEICPLGDRIYLGRGACKARRGGRG